MSKFFSLLKASMSGGIQMFNYHGKTKRSRWTVPLLLATFVGVMMLFSASAMTAELKTEGGESAILSIYVLITAAIILMEGVYKCGDLLFKPRDNDMLLAMPVKRSVIVSTRIIKLYVFELLYCMIFLLPAIIAYAINTEVGASFYLTSVTMLILVPVIPIAISCVIGLITSALSARFRHKTILQVIFSFIILFAFAAIVLAVNTRSDIDGHMISMTGDKINQFFYPAAAFVNLATDFNIWQYLLFVAINLAVIVVAVLLIGKFYFQTINRMNIVKRGANKEVKYKSARHSQTSAMVRKELTKYFNTPVLLTNTAVGLVLFIVAAGALCFNYDGLVESLTTSLENFPLTAEEIHSLMPSVAFGLVAFASLMTFITATMISLERKSFNLLKSMPISGRKIIMTKVLTAMLLIVPVTLLGAVVMAIRFQFGIIDTLLVIVGVIALPLVTELIGILIDLKYARFDAETDAVVVKQSAGVMVATFLGLGMVLTTISLTFGAVFLAGQTVGLLIMDAVFAVVALFLYFVIAARGEEKILKLTA
ncbi:hypothetical protein J5491_02645 [Candidatus Saccharibacteria bacterium]|nr:hypothetical protein [Candidatus Saccharibacteria bacterium]